jgi:hypothetical protein
VQSLKTQDLETFVNEKKAIIKESNSFRGIPYAEYFSVNTIWTVNEISPQQCKVVIELDVVFHYSTWLSGTIRSNTSAELQDVFTTWEQYAEHKLQTKQSLKKPSTKANSLEEGVQVTQSLSADSEEGKESIEDKDSSAASVADEWRAGDELYDKDEDLTFYDCEEGEFEDDDTTALLARQQQSFFRTNSAAELHGIYSSSIGRRPGSDDLPSTHSMAVTVVETTFVFAEFSFWQVRVQNNKCIRHDLM